VVLADGSKVWLNAESSIRYPSSFVDTRQIFVTGETYVEVTKDAARPFIVSVNGLAVQAMGTHFNINSYANEGPIETTVIEGSVKVSEAYRSAVLKPSEQINNSEWKVKRVDISQVTGWVNNEFVLKRTNIKEIMRDVERWYGAKVIFKDDINVDFFGRISRAIPVSGLLFLLEQTGHVHFKISGNEITVMK
jgi:ferric-dicitrate binding protein FerR (iron transport regulator)